MINIGPAIALFSLGQGISTMVGNHTLPDSWSNLFNISGILFDAEDMTNFLVIRYRDTEISETIQATYENEVTMNRATPIFSYSHTSPRTINIGMYFIGDWWPMVQVKRKVDWMKTFLYARDNGLTIKPPKEVMLMLGMYLTVRGQITSVNVTHNYGGAPPWGISIGQSGKGGGTLSMYSTIAKVDVTIQETAHFWTGGQITYDEAVKDMNFRLTSGEPPGLLNSALNLL